MKKKVYGYWKITSLNLNILCESWPVFRFTLMRTSRSNVDWISWKCRGAKLQTILTWRQPMIMYLVHVHWMPERSNFNFKIYFQNILNKEPCGNFHSMMEYTCKETFDRKKNQEQSVKIYLIWMKCNRPFDVFILLAHS